MSSKTSPFVCLLVLTGIASAHGAVNNVIDLGSGAGRANPSWSSGLGSPAGSLSVQPSSWQITATNGYSGVQGGLPTPFSLSSQPAGSRLALNLRKLAGNGVTTVRVILFNAAWSASSTYEFPIGPAGTTDYSLIAASTVLTSPIASSNGGINWASMTAANIQILGYTTTSNFGIEIESIKVVVPGQLTYTLGMTGITPINATGQNGGNISASSAHWEISAANGYGMVQMATPALDLTSFGAAPLTNHLALEIEGLPANTTQRLRLIFFNSDWSRSSTYAFHLAGTGAQGATVVKASTPLQAPIAAVNGGINWAVDKPQGLQILASDTTSNSTAIRLSGLGAVAETYPTLGRRWIRLGTRMGTVTPAWTSGINAGTFTNNWNRWSFGAPNGYGGGQVGLNTLSVKGLNPAHALALVGAVGPTNNVTTVAVTLTAAGGKSSTYRLPIGHLTSNPGLAVAGSGLGSPFSSAGGGVNIGTDTLSAIQVYAVNGTKFDLSVLEFRTINPGASYAEWAAWVYGPNGSPSETAQSANSPDGRPNFTAYAYADPQDSLSIAGVIDGRLTVDFVRGGTQRDLRWLVEGSNNLTTWTNEAASNGSGPLQSLSSNVTVSETWQPDGSRNVRVTDNAGSGQSRFLRVRAVASPAGSGLTGSNHAIENLDGRWNEMGTMVLYNSENRNPRYELPAGAAQDASFTPFAWQTGSAGQTETISALNPRILYTGRFAPSGNNVRFNFSGSTITARFQGTSLRATFTGGDPNGHFFDVVLNGDTANRRTFRIVSAQTITIASGLPDTEHTVEIVHRTGVWQGVVTFAGFRLDAGKGLVNPSPRLARKIEFVGDSVTAGGANVYPAGYSGTEFGEDVEKSSQPLAFGGLTARALGAEAHSVAISGVSVVAGKGYTGFNMQAVYDKALIDTAAPLNSPTWDITSWTPQAVVINLGQNDLATQSNLATFRTSYKQLLAAIHAARPNAKIFCVAGNMGLSGSTSYLNEISNAVQEFKTESGFTDVYTEFFAPKNTDGHPRRNEHEAMADVLIPLIRQQMNW